jgi:hypothetical protein
VWPHLANVRQRWRYRFLPVWLGLAVVVCCCGPCGWAAQALYLLEPDTWVTAVPGNGCVGGAASKDQWSDPHATLRCADGYSELSTSGSTVTATEVERSVPSPRRVRLSRLDYLAVQATVTGGSDVRGGVTLRTFVGDADPQNSSGDLLLFSTLHPDRWQIIEAEGEMASGVLPTTTELWRTVRIEVSVHTYDVTFLVDDVAVTRIKLEAFHTYLPGLGVACTGGSCSARFKNYTYQLW